MPFLAGFVFPESLIASNHQVASLPRRCATTRSRPSDLARYKARSQRLTMSSTPSPLCEVATPNDAVTRKPELPSSKSVLLKD